MFIYLLLRSFDGPVTSATMNADTGVFLNNTFGFALTDVHGATSSMVNRHGGCENSAALSTEHQDARGVRGGVRRDERDLAERL